MTDPQAPGPFYAERVDRAIMLAEVGLYVGVVGLMLVLLLLGTYVVGRLHR